MSKSSPFSLRLGLFFRPTTYFWWPGYKKSLFGPFIFTGGKLTHDHPFFASRNHPTVAIRPASCNPLKISNTAEQHPAVDTLIIAAPLVVYPTSPCRSGGYSRVRPPARPFLLCYGKYEFFAVPEFRFSGVVLLDIFTCHPQYQNTTLTERDPGSIATSAQSFTSGAIGATNLSQFPRSPTIQLKM